MVAICSAKILRFYIKNVSLYFFKTTLPLPFSFQKIRLLPRVHPHQHPNQSHRHISTLQQQHLIKILKIHVDLEKMLVVVSFVSCTMQRLIKV